MRTNCSSSGIDRAIVMAIDQLISVGPAHGNFSPTGYAVSIGESAQITSRTGVIAFYQCIVVQHLGKLLAAYWLIRTEGVILITLNNTVFFGPDNGV